MNRPLELAMAAGCIALVWSGYRSSRLRSVSVDSHSEPVGSGPLADEMPEQPALPAGWLRYRGAVSALASSKAKAALALPIGSLYDFTDAGKQLAAFVEWHHDAARGWHKGASLLERRAA